jgi:hypothetical protein
MISRPIDYQIEVMQACRAGKTIEWKNDDHKEWSVIGDPSWNWFKFDYRVKPEPSYAELQDKWLNDNGVMVGDTVKVISANEEDLKGHGGWDYHMFRLVGKTGLVRSICVDYIAIIMNDTDCIWCFPYMSLEKVRKSEPRYVPLTHEDIPPLCWVRLKIGGCEGNHAIVVEICRSHITTINRAWTYKELMDTGREYSVDRKEWKPCRKGAE